MGGDPCTRAVLEPAAAGPVMVMVCLRELGLAERSVTEPLLLRDDTRLLSALALLCPCVAFKND